MQLAKQLGARRFEAECMGIVAATLIPEDPAQALQLAKEALHLGRETGMSYCGPMLLSMVARLTPSGPERASALAEGEQLLAAGCVSHSYFEFYGNAIEAGLQDRDWPSVRRYADSLSVHVGRAAAVDGYADQARAVAGGCGRQRDEQADARGTGSAAGRVSADECERSVDGGRSGVDGHKVTICRTVRPSARRSNPSLS